jgi:RNA polymerase sigma factor (TIGR02999 family)
MGTTPGDAARATAGAAPGPALAAVAMSDVTPILSAIERGDARAAEQLLPLVYDELRKLAAQRLAQEKPGQTLQATALVHEAYRRLVGGDPDRPWEGRGHFFAAAAEAMRRILVERVRRKRRRKHGDGRLGQDSSLDDLADPETRDPLEVLAVHEALDLNGGENGQHRAGEEYHTRLTG